LGSTKAIEPISNSWRSGAGPRTGQTFEIERSILAKGCNGLSGVLAEMLQSTVGLALAASNRHRAEGRNSLPTGKKQRISPIQPFSAKNRFEYIRKFNNLSETACAERHGN
jgi:hypothetical protein